MFCSFLQRFKFEAERRLKLFILCSSRSPENQESEVSKFCFERQWKGGQLVAFPGEVIVFCNQVHCFVLFSSVTFTS